MYRNVLIATDLLPTSAPALRDGLRLARSQAATVGVLYVIEVWMVERQWFTRVSKEDVAFHKDFLAREEEAVSREMRAQIDRARSDQPIDTVDTLVRQGRAPDEIAAIAAQRACVPIVIGTRGRPDTLGSVAEQARIDRSWDARADIRTTIGRRLPALRARAAETTSCCCLSSEAPPAGPGVSHDRADRQHVAPGPTALSERVLGPLRGRRRQRWKIPNRRSRSTTATSSSNAVITLLVTRRAREVARAGPVPVARWVTDWNPPRSEVRVPPLPFPERRRRRVRPTQTL